MKRRKFIKTSAAGAGAVAFSHGLPASANAQDAAVTVIDRFERADSLIHGAEWESLNPGY